MPFLGGRGQASRGFFGFAAVPNAPTSVVSTKENGQISVAFSAPSFNGGLPITTYQYALSTDSYATFITRSTGTTASPLVITGLTNGTSYGVKLRAVNSLGAGVTSGAATAVIPSTVPNAPTSVSGTANGVTSSTVTWTAPANNGGAAVSGYKVEYAASPYSSYTVFTADTGNTNTSISVTGLVNGGSYKFRVSATNLNGFGATAESGVVVTNVVPAAPTISTVTLGTGASNDDTYSWTAPTANGGSAITTYYFSSTLDDGATFIYTDIDLLSTAVSKAFDLDYTTAALKIKVAAGNSLGRGPYSALSTAAGSWGNPSYSIDGTAGCPDCAACACPACPACACGTSNSSGSASQTGSKGTRSKTCYQWTRAGNNTVGPYDQGGTTACTAAFSACTAGNCGCSNGTCACSACGTNSNYLGVYNANVLWSSNRGYPFSYEVSIGEYVWGGMYNGSMWYGFACGGGQGLAGPSAITYCDATGVFTTNDGTGTPDTCHYFFYCC